MKQSLTAETMKNTIFWDMTPCSLEEVYRRTGGTTFLHARFVQKTLQFYQTIRRHIPEDSTLQAAIPQFSVLFKNKVYQLTSCY
jgi:hypothetical protein